ncbi:MAG: chitobiase/beta-hexosaminidase C-terminal domain-containing protein [Bacteroidota bacterium]
MLRRILLIFLLASLWGVAQQPDVFFSDLDTGKKPWTHLDFANDPKDFQFAIVTDRTGGPRPGIFEDAMEKLNWLMPEFVITVGDLIRGAEGRDSVKLAKQWKAHFNRIEPLKMPFFHLAGNHDIKANNDFQVAYWNRLFGAPYYSFVYKDVLFLALFTNQGTQILSAEQIAYFEKVLQENKNVRWTMVFMHHPLWRYPHMSNFEKLEGLLQERDFTVFAGHQHRYNYSKKGKSNYYVLATTGGGSELLGNRFGMFDHITWVTMTDDGPQLANLKLDGILPHDIADQRTEALSQDLVKSVFYDSQVFVDNASRFTRGRAYITYTNVSDLPIRVKGRFYHNHYVSVRPGEISEVVPPKGTKTIPIALQAIESFDLKENIKLELEGSLYYEDPEYKDLKLKGVTEIPIKVSDYQVLPIEEDVFFSTASVSMQNTIPGVSVHYTLDGSNPDALSPVYTEPITVKKEGSVKAVLLTEEGWMGKVDQMKLKPLKPGKGMIAEVYDLNTYGKSDISMPDFDLQQPTRVRVAEEFDPMRIAQKEREYAIRYWGTLEVDKSGTYDFHAISDDAIALRIDGRPVLSDLVKHKAREVSGSIDLKKGKHKVEIQYFQFRRNYALELWYRDSKGKKIMLTPKDFRYGE